MVGISKYSFAQYGANNTAKAKKAKKTKQTKQANKAKENTQAKLNAENKQQETKKADTKKQGKDLSTYDNALAQYYKAILGLSSNKKNETASTLSASRNDRTNITSAYRKVMNELSEDKMNEIANKYSVSHNDINNDDPWAYGGSGWNGGTSAGKINISGSSLNLSRNIPRNV